MKPAMDLMTIAKSFPDMTVSIRLRDLMDANEALVRKVREECEQEQQKRERQYGDVLIPKKDVVAMLGNPDPSTLWRWEKEGYLPKVKIGAKVFYRRSSIDRLIEAKQEQHA